MNHTDSYSDSHAEYELEQKKRSRIKLITHLMAIVNIVIGFFCLWEFAAAMRYVIGFSTEIYWLSKAWWQQVSFIFVAILFMFVVLGGQYLYEKEMLEKGRKVPISFAVLTAIELVFLLVCWLITEFYFSWI